MDMLSSGLRIIDGASAGAWIEPRLAGEFGAVTLQVPKGFEAYARIFHSASDPDGGPVKWAEVAKACGTVPHREMQWHAILGLADADEVRGSYNPDDPTGVKWAGSDPMIGAMDIETLDALCEILAVHTLDMTRCFFGLCTIQGWKESFSEGDLKSFLRLPYERDHIVLAGPLSAVDQTVRDWSKLSSTRMIVVADEEGPSSEPDPGQSLQREAPNLMWPANRTWFVASEIDFDSTLVGGTIALIETIVECPELEAYQVRPTDSLAADGDKVNVAKTSGRH